MCGIAGIIGNGPKPERLEAMVAIQRHRGPDGEGAYLDPSGSAALGHNRLSIIDLSDAGRQPMSSRDGKVHIVLNGEIYNYIEIRRELESEFEFTSRSDTEVLLNAYRKWGAACLDKLIGMFAFIIWDESTQSTFAARDRFGVKPLYYHETSDGTLLIASEIKALHAAGVPRVPNQQTWATYFTSGISDHGEQTFWKGINSLPAGHKICWKANKTTVSRWYDIAERVGGEFDQRSENEVEHDYFELMKESVKLRFRSDVPVGINLSGGLDSSSLLGLVHAVQGEDSDVKAFTFTTGDANYDELPWVRQMLDRTNHLLIESRLSPDEVPSLTAEVSRSQDEPFSGIPTLAYAKLFESARAHGVIVLLDGNGMDEQWAGYDYYKASSNEAAAPVVQGSIDSAVRPECLDPEFRSLASRFDAPEVFVDKLRNLQYRDTRFTKIPRAMRFNDRISMRSSTELREPFLDHRMFELAFRQPADRKISNGTRKKMLRQISKKFLPLAVSESPKRPLQTPQREWLRGVLREWANERIEIGLQGEHGNWLDRESVRKTWKGYCAGESDNSFYVWQWISLSFLEGN